MNKLNYSISLREKGFASNEMKKKMREKGFEDSEILYYLKRSDEIYLNQLIRDNKTSQSKGKLSKGIKIIIIIILALSLMLLISAFLGYATIGIFGLFIIWSLVGFSSYR
jgi:hypothetical protein